MTKLEHQLMALDAFVRQRSGMDFQNYGDVSSYRQEQRRITRQLHDYRALRSAVVAFRDSLDLQAVASRAYSGRLSFVERGDSIGVDYCTGQYFPVEYRAAACAVLAQAIWDAWRGECPKDHPKPGEYIRHQARCCFGRSIQKRWFD